MRALVPSTATRHKTSKTNQSRSAWGGYDNIANQQHLNSWVIAFAVKSGHIRIGSNRECGVHSVVIEIALNAVIRAVVGVFHAARVARATCAPQASHDDSAIKGAARRNATTSAAVKYKRRVQLTIAHHLRL